MKTKLLALLTLTIIFLSCAKNNEDQKQPIDKSIPSCIQEILDDSIKSSKILDIKVQELDGELHYWLETGARAYDGTELVIDGKCNTVCRIGGWNPPDCSFKYINNWEIIWKK